MSTETLLVTVVKVVCCNCHVVFGVESEMHAALRKSHDWFYCPNGHQQHYTGESEEARLQRALETAKRREEWLERERDSARRAEQHAARRLSAAQGVVTRTKNRIKNGMCPCCNRHFENLHRHMKSLHPEYAAEAKS